MPDEPVEYYLIWSFEHDGWWKRGSGYTTGRQDFEEAGRFTEAEAKEICRKANFVGFEEAMLPLTEHTLAGEREKLRRARDRDG
jgi:hypothetical protein